MSSETNLTIQVGDKLLGRVINAAGEALDNGPALDDLPRRDLPELSSITEAATGPVQFLETGIKVIDLLIPIRRGGVISVHSEYGLGKLVVLGELIHNLSQRLNARMVFAWKEARNHQVSELIAEQREMGVQDKVVQLFTPLKKVSELRQPTVLAAIAIAEHFRDEDSKEVLLHIDAELIQPAELEWLSRRLISKGGGAITLFLSTFAEQEAAEDLLKNSSNLDGKWQFDRNLAKNMIYPALDRLNSTSAILKAEIVGTEHVEIAQQVKQLLERYYTLQGQMQPDNLDKLAGVDRETVERGRRVELFLTQPMFVAEPYSGNPGQFVELSETLRGCKELIEGRYDNLPEEAFRFIGSINQATQKAAQL